MKRKISMLLVVAMLAALCVSFIPAQASNTTDYLTVEKNVYSKTEEIKVKVNALPDPVPNNFYIALYEYPYVIGSTTGAVWVNVKVNNQQTVFEGDTITITQNSSTRVGTYSVALLEYKTNGTVEDNLIHVGPYFEPTKEEFTVGEKITIDYSNITTEIGDCWLGLYKKNQGTDTRNQMWTYFVNGGSLTKGTSGTLTIPDDMETGEITNGNIPEGEYKVVLLKSSNKAVLSNVAYFTVGAPVKTPALSVEKTTFTEGEDIVVSYSDITTTLGKGVWLALYKKNPVFGTDQSYVWTMLTSSTDGSLVHGESGTFTFPEDAEGGSVVQGNGSIVAGEYELMILDAAYGVIGEKVAITVKEPVGAPKLSVSKDIFTVGEDIEVSFENISEELGKGAWVALYKKGATLGTDQSYVWFYVTDSSTGTLVRGAGGTVTLPADADGGAVPQGKATLEAGEYELMILSAGYEVLSDRVSVTIQAKNSSTGDTSVMFFATMVVCTVGAFIFVKRKQYN